jgi:hypothetical protein
MEEKKYPWNWDKNKVQFIINTKYKQNEKFTMCDLHEYKYYWSNVDRILSELVMDGFLCVEHTPVQCHTTKKVRVGKTYCYKDVVVGSNWRTQTLYYIK